MRACHRKSVRLFSALIAVAFVLTTTSAFAQTVARDREAAPEVSSKEAPKVSTNASQNAAAATGQQAASDATKQKGFREPTKEEIRVLLEGMREYMNHSTEGLTPVRHPNGMMSIDLQGRFENVTTAKRNADGTVSLECVETLEAARKFLEGKLVTTPAMKLGATPKATLNAATPKPAPAAKPVLEEK